MKKEIIFVGLLAAACQSAPQSNEDMADSPKNPDRVAAVVAQTNAAQKAVVEKFFERSDGPNFTCDFRSRGETALDEVVCERLGSDEVCMRGQFRDGVAKNQEYCMTTPLEARVSYAVLVPVSPNEQHLLQSWQLLPAGETDFVEYNTLFVKFYDKGWQPQFAGFGEPSQSMAPYYAPMLNHRPQ
ncbi:MAG: hypothetical protein RIB03_05700 [Henriciella sp.]|uniref:hypothetical protein n=1 Tax=Henriciella sp. TaxID=1968823 RepID=UPI0032ED1B95